MLLHDRLKDFRLILASQSPRRQQLLADAGLRYELAPRFECDEVFPDDMVADDVAGYLSRLKSEAYPAALGERDILFIDEIHRMSRAVEEVLYPAMEDYEIDIIIGKGPAARSFRMKLPKFTLIGATTRAGQLSTPLRDRFGVLLKLELYSPEDLDEIVKRSAGIMGYEITRDGAMKIAECSRGTPRIANRLLKRVRDFAQIKGTGVIDEKIATFALTQLEIDHLGLDNVDRRMLETIINLYHGGPVGLETLAVTVGEEAITIEDVYEPYLVRIGFMARTPRGRCATKLAYDHLGIRFPTPTPAPGTAQTGLFDEE